MTGERPTPDEYIAFLEQLHQDIEELPIPDFDRLIERSTLGSPVAKHLQEIGQQLIENMHERKRQMNEQISMVEKVAKLLAKQSTDPDKREGNLTFTFEGPTGATLTPAVEEHWATLSERDQSIFVAKAQEVSMFLAPERISSPNGVQISIWAPEPQPDYKVTLADVKVTREEPRDLDEIVWEVTAEDGGKTYHGYGRNIPRAMWDLIGKRIPQ